MCHTTNIYIYIYIYIYMARLHEGTPHIVDSIGLQSIQLCHPHGLTPHASLGGNSINQDGGLYNGIL